MNGPPVRLLIAGWIAIALLFVLAWLLFARGMGRLQDFRAPASSGVLAVGQQLPEVPLEFVNDRPTSTRAFSGHPLWLNFFATWCTPCKAELPEIERRYKSDRAAGLVVFGIDQQESKIAVTEFTKHFGVTYPIAIDGGAAALRFDVRTLPLSVFVDAGGTVRSIRIGQMQPEAMDEALRAILPAH